MKRKTYILAALAAIVLAMTVILSVELWRFKSAQNAQAVTIATQTTESLTTALGERLAGVESKARAMGETFGEREYSQLEIEDILRQASLDNPEIRGVTACFEPFAFNPETKLFCPYYNKSTSEFVYVEDSYDYTIPGSGTAWYTGIIDDGAKWVEPYYGAAAQDWYIDYGVPFYWTQGPRKGQVRGIIDFTLSAKDFKTFVHSLSVGKTNQEFLVTQNGNFVSHPIAEYLGTKTLNDLIAEDPNPSLQQAYRAMQNGEQGHVKYRDIESGSTGYFFYDTVPPANYRIGASFLTQDMVGSSRPVSRRIIHIALAFSTFLILIIAMIFGRDELDRREIEQLSLLTTGLLICVVVLIGWLQHNDTPEFDANQTPPIVNTDALDKFIVTVNDRADSLKIAAPTTVPTGVYIERLEFADSYNVNISGQIWMKYPENLADNPDIGFGLRFPQISPFAESAMIEEVQREIIPAQEGADGYLHILWDYRVTLRMNLEYGNFPFDKRHLNIEISPLSASDNIVLVPDLSSYEVTNPSRMPGISADIDLPGSAVTKTYFNFELQNYTTDFGYGSKTMFQNVPTLQYNVHLRRKLLNAFITYLIPIFVTLSLIYILILACEKTEARQGIIESMAAFFFVLIFSHIDLRKDIVTADLIFIEYFYFATYLMVILSTANLIAYTKSRTSLFDYNDNQLYRAVYFPIFFTLMLIVMLWKFY